ncbi:hypothetical protein ACWEQP_31720 [Streptomyces sp. NPDC004044]
MAAAAGAGRRHGTEGLRHRRRPARYGVHSAAKAASWALTGPVRQELAPRGIAVPALHVGFMDTGTAAHVPAGQKIDPVSMATQALDCLQSGLPEILADDCGRPVEKNLATQPAAA